MIQLSDIQNPGKRRDGETTDDRLVEDLYTPPKNNFGEVSEGDEVVKDPSELELDERDLEPAAVVFLTYPFALVFFVFLAIFVLWYLGYFGYSDVN